MKMTYTKGYPSRDIHLAKQGISIKRSKGYPSSEARDIHLTKEGMLMKEGVFRREGI
jgi:hypothetical protein